MASSGEMEVSGEGGGSFMLSCVIAAHGGDVKSLAGSSSEFIVSGSRDGSAKVFSQRMHNFIVPLDEFVGAMRHVDAILPYTHLEVIFWELVERLHLTWRSARGCLYVSIRDVVP
uniref:Uncharacterized protein n=1 Tax=Parascaris equorum TaxID=6256 RepID=A0A914RZP0_PAREQ